MNLLREPKFARLSAASLLSEVAEWILQVSLPLTMYRLTGSAASTAVMMIIGLVPAVVVSPIAGPLADRGNRHRVLCAVSLAQAAVAVPLLLAEHVAVLYVVMAAQAGLAAISEPTRNALVPQLVGPERVTAANGLMSVNANVARLLGAWAGGVLLGLGGLGLTVGVYAAVLVLAGALFAPRFAAGLPGSGERPHVLRQWVDGLAEIRRNPALRVTSVAVVLQSIAQGMFLVLFLVFVLESLRGDEADVGLLRGVQAVGGLAAGVLVATVARRVAPAKLFGWGALAMGVYSALIWNTAHLTTAMAVFVGLFAVAGGPGVFLGSGVLSVIQTVTPPELTGRVLSTAFAGIAAAQALGMQVAGALADRIDLEILLDVQASLFLPAGALVLLRLARRRSPALT
ncbi:MFS transporter [Amycolatopsis magusensis]|uniref:MFS family arabinose efflux permease n=1 Tax=Amycolatopsis magusensis TaxID=882444 RepID=A0ABS4PXC0_9PSEU|nr:MFS transporter [Amycolatopsis magusensis]MBP2183221.1 putative MFS family arabinose efflux permease [Amycolatopsis magusensis]